jgi:hypothetical protein
LIKRFAKLYKAAVMRRGCGWPVNYGIVGTPKAKLKAYPRYPV